MKRRINISIVILVVLSAIVTMIFLTAAYNNLYEKELEKDLELIARFVQEQDMVNEEDILQTENTFGKDGIRIVLTDPEGKVLSGNAADTEKWGTYAEKTYSYELQLDNGNILVVSRVTESIRHYLKLMMPSLLMIVLVLFAASLVVAYFLTRKLVSPIEDLAVNMDGSNRMAYYEELEPFIQRIRQQHEDLVKSAKLRQEFTANVTHELKTPLTSISGYAELIETGLASGEDTVRFARGIHKNANRLLTLINDIIRLSELDSNEEELVTEQLNLYQLAKVCVEMLAPNAEKHRVTISIQGEDCTINGNRMMIEELLYNLCDNAIRYNNENGSVLVDVHPLGEQVVLIVNDTGIGIPKAYQERIFERFYRIDKSRSKSTGGTGLGLAIVKHILEKHDAKLEVDSDIGKGTTMRIYFK